MVNLENGIPEAELLINGVKQLGLMPSAHKIDQLMAYVRLLQKWNKVYSLTAITKTEHIITHHLLDGLTIVPYAVNAKKIIDVGSGMGVPGIILAIWQPETNVTLLDSNQKKCAFLQQVVIELGLVNVQVVSTRVEKYVPSDKFDIIISRAFANINLFISLSRHLLVDGGYFLAMKSKPKNDEIIDNCTLIKVKIPGVDDERVLLKIKHNNTQTY